MTNITELTEQRDALDAKIAAAKAAERAPAIAQIRNLCEAHGLSANDIFGKAKGAARKPTGPVAPKYRDPATGSTWTGRGKAPSWIAGVADRTFFAIPTTI